MFINCPFSGDLSSWVMPELQMFERVFSNFHDSILGWIGVFEDHYDFPKNHPRAAQFEDLRALCAGLNMDPLSAARFVHAQMNLLTMVPHTNTTFDCFDGI